MSNKEVTLDDYILTNIDVETGYFTIRLKDEKEYIVYRRKGSKDFIIKDNIEMPLSDEVKKIHLEEVRIYQTCGI